MNMYKKNYFRGFSKSMENDVCNLVVSKYIDYKGSKILIKRSKYIS